MHTQHLGLVARFWLALLAPWKILFDSQFGTKVGLLRQAQPEAQASPDAAPTQAAKRHAAAPVEVNGDAALQLLAMMQREGRLIDFLQEDVAAFSDAEIGAAARVVHEGCRRALTEHILLAPIRSESEGQQVVLQAGYDAARTRITGNVVGSPPYTGRLAHHGWQAIEVRLPTVTSGHDPKVLAPAEVEL